MSLQKCIFVNLVDETEVPEGRSCYEAMQMLTILQPYPSDTDKASLSLPGKSYLMFQNVCKW